MEACARAHELVDLNFAPSPFFYSLCQDLLEGSVTGEGSSLSRIAQKFLEVFAAGLATAVSGFLIAHFTGIFVATPPAPTVKQPLAIQDGVQSGTQAAIQARPAEP